MRSDYPPLPIDGAAPCPTLTIDDLDALRPTLHRMRRLAQAIFHADEADVLIVCNGVVWRASDPDRRRIRQDPAGARVMAGRELVWIRDIRLDPSLADHPMIAAGPRFVAYVGAPILLSDGRCIGALSVVGKQPYLFDSELAFHLKDLAVSVGSACDRSLALKQRDAALECSLHAEQRLRIAVQNAGMYVYEVDYRRRDLFKIGAERQIYGHEKSYDDLTRDPWGGVHPDDLAMVRQDFDDHVAKGEPYRIEHRILREDGQVVWVSSTAELFLDDQGQPERLIGALQDISPRKRSEAEMVLASQAAETANVAKSTFLAIMSHEIRTPLNGVLGMAQAMAMDELSPGQRARLGVIQTAGETLLTLLNDLLDLSKVETGKVELADDVVDVSALFTSAQAVFTALAQGKSLYFAGAVAPQARGYWRGDEARIRQILYNLIANAVKFTQSGSVQLDIGRRGDLLVFQVSDTGEGIPELSLPLLFDKFVQADPSVTRRYGGSGLGLAICRELSRLMGGEIVVTSVEGQGSIFTVTLPLKRAERVDAPLPVTPSEPSEAPAVDLRILAAEDNPMNQLVLKTLLGAFGVALEVVNNGQEAVDAWLAGDWDAILMDVQMPVMDGVTATRMIRQCESREGRRRTPIIALTANAMTHQEAEYLAAGMDAMSPKPIELPRLLSAIQSVLFAPGSEDADANVA